MDWIAPYRNQILQHLARFQQNSFSLIGDDDFSLRFTDGDVLVSFSVERYSDSLSVWVEYLGDNPTDDEKYRLDIIMRIYLKQNLTDVFKVTTDSDKSRIVRIYVDFILNNKTTLFTKSFPLAKEYFEFNRELGLRALEQFGKT